MALSISTRETHGVTVVEVAGRLTMGEGCQALNQQLETLVGDGRSSLLLELSGTQVIDSQGIEVLVRHYTTLTQRGGGLKLLRPSARVREVLKIAGLLDYLHAFDNETDALQSLGRGAA